MLPIAPNCLGSAIHQKKPSRLDTAFCTVVSLEAQFYSFRAHSDAQRSTGRRAGCAHSSLSWFLGNAIPNSNCFSLHLPLGLAVTSSSRRVRLPTAQQTTRRSAPAESLRCLSLPCRTRQQSNGGLSGDRHLSSRRSFDRQAIASAAASDVVCLQFHSPVAILQNTTVQEATIGSPLSIEHQIIHPSLHE